MKLKIYYRPTFGGFAAGENVGRTFTPDAAGAQCQGRPSICRMSWPWILLSGSKRHEILVLNSADFMSDFYAFAYRNKSIKTLPVRKNKKLQWLKKIKNALTTLLPTVK